MENNKPIIGILLGDPSGIGPELVSKLLSHQEIEKANIVVIGEKNVLHEANKLTGNNCDLEYVESYEQVKFNVKNKFFLDISKGKNHSYKISECSSESGESVLNALECALDLAKSKKIDAINFDMKPDRTPLYGYTDRSILDFSNKVITDLRESLNKSTQKWDKTQTT